MTTTTIPRLVERLRELVPNGLRRGAGSKLLASTERRFGVHLPDDMRAFYTLTDGTNGETEPEHGWTTFWSLDHWARAATVTRKLPDSGDAIVIADHCLSSWWFAMPFHVGPDAGHVVLVDGVRSAKLVAASFTEFLEATLDNRSALYPDQ